MKEYRFRISEDERLIMIQILRPYLEALKYEREILLGKIDERIKHHLNKNTADKYGKILSMFIKSQYEALGIEDPLEGINALISIVSNILNRFEHPGRGRKRQEHPLTQENS
jgi:hypothetical protein